MLTRTHFDLFGGGGGDLAHDDSVILLEGDLVLRLSNVSATHHIADDLSSHAPIIPTLSAMFVKVSAMGVSGCSHTTGNSSDFDNAKSIGNSNAFGMANFFWRAFRLTVPNG